ncbi:hypothetical protein BDN70DRAFT_435913 [Pholiota conissans]|uniref:Uncharacterized protein n=1 Tax=Pholiota conissans TaxID=109636 RepID=A0A9P5Z8X1_9AGAR|nr:hypothetical protein BDN70DRAFT_435913 [Pholiota conissans]
MTSVRQLPSSKRPEALADPYQPPSSSLTLAFDQYATSMTGFLSLSDEMYLEILSHFPVYSFPAQFSRNDAEIYGQTRLTISALSRTCRKLRRIFLRYLWQRIEVYHRMDLGKGPLHKIQHANGKMRLLSGSRVYAMELVQQLETVTIRNPRLAEYVNVLDILVVDYSAKTILPELAWCIEQMPNLHTVHIQFALNESQYNLIPQSFSAYTYPQIKNMFVTTNGSSLLRHCPNAQLVHPLWARWWDIENFLHGIIPACSFIETLGPIPVLGSTFSGSFESGTLDFYISQELTRHFLQAK